MAHHPWAPKSETVVFDGTFEGMPPEGALRLELRASNPALRNRIRIHLTLIRRPWFISGPLLVNELDKLLGRQQTPSSVWFPVAARDGGHGSVGETQQPLAVQKVLVSQQNRRPRRRRNRGSARRSPQ